MIADIETLENNQNAESDTIETKKIELENIKKEKLQGIIIRSRVKWAEEGEKPNQVLLQLEIEKLYLQNHLKSQKRRWKLNNKTGRNTFGSKRLL